MNPEYVNISPEPAFNEAIFAKNLADSFRAAEKIVKGEGTADFISYIESYLREMMLKRRDKEVVRKLKEMYLTARRINQNANQRLALENLILSIRRHTEYGSNG